MARDLLYRVYERRLAREVGAGDLPAHVGVILDGNRRYAAARLLDAAALQLGNNRFFITGINNRAAATAGLGQQPDIVVIKGIYRIHIHDDFP